jgi:hypothetical protein
VGPESIREYAARQMERYRKAGKRQKGRIIDEVVAVTGFHRKSAIRLLGGRRRSGGERPVGRPPVYGPDVAAAARLLYEAAGGIGSKRLHPFVPELAGRLVALGELDLPEGAVRLLEQASPATLDRLIGPDRVVMRRRVRSLTRPGTVLRQHIPVRTFGEWDDAAPGYVQMDTVAHCGHTVEGFFLWTVTAVDVATGWVEMDAVWGRTQERVAGAIGRIRRRLPVKLLGIDCDNGSEFINHGLFEYCQKAGIMLTRGRPWKKNDSAHVEQKNGAVIRRLTGHGRYSSPQAFAKLRQVYSLARLHVNFFQPVGKLVAKRREGARAIRIYDEAATPYRRMLESGVLTPARRAVLERLYSSLNPLDLSRRIYSETEALLRLASRPGDSLTWSGWSNRSFEAKAPAGDGFGNRDF